MKEWSSRFKMLRKMKEIGRIYLNPVLGLLPCKSRKLFKRNKIFQIGSRRKKSSLSF